MDELTTGHAGRYDDLNIYLSVVLASSTTLWLEVAARQKQQKR